VSIAILSNDQVSREAVHLSLVNKPRGEKLTHRFSNLVLIKVTNIDHSGFTSFQQDDVHHIVIMPCCFKPFNK